jgi:uroporphyrinogen decarboxylase
MALDNNNLLQALEGKVPQRVPVWIMRQAGRYLPEYRRVRSSVDSFIALYKNPALACEVTLQPLERFDLDAAIVFSDILTIPEALGLGLEFIEGKGPVFAKPITSEVQIKSLPAIDVADNLHYVFDAVALVKQELAGKVPLIGFTGSPFTLATYMLQGSSAKEFTKIRELMFSQPQGLHLLLTKLTQIIKDYVLEQVKAGADVIQIFDTWGNLLSPSNYQEFSLNYMQQIVQHLADNQLSAKVPTTIFTKNTANYLPNLAKSSASCISVDWTSDLEAARKLLDTKKAVQGNLDPTVLLGSDQSMLENIHATLERSAWRNGGYVFNLGHGIYPQTQPDKVKLLVDTVHAHTSI